MCSARSLRTCGCFLLVSPPLGRAFLWVGERASASSRTAARNVTSRLVQRMPVEFGVRRKITDILEVVENDEPTEFQEGLTGRGTIDRTTYPTSRSTDDEQKRFWLDEDTETRLYRLSSVTGLFQASVVDSPARTRTAAFPFLQEDLYRDGMEASFCLLDTGHILYLWCGWLPDAVTNYREDSLSEVLTGSSRLRFETDKRCAFIAAHNYVEEKGRQGYVVYAGYEPRHFKGRFPWWTDRADVRQSNWVPGRQDNTAVPLSAEITSPELTYDSITTLQSVTRPAGVDPMRLEAHLSDKEFKKHFKMTKKEFYELPEWKRNERKKELNLF